ncbi:asparagine synthase (glutamine-hydrolyzing) [Cumulibacter manganitolerans]|uniref:asparagine synthase (glutamine-hydrolyzing) n=1 Tax=Cumulibacter manganitolerans TaxID=1884992 RepID=UPI001295E7A6|nr:asparagine synthase (glutamine-hydrolyzing) [Cumulibacter manganitolerans]
MCGILGIYRADGQAAAYAEPARAALPHMHHRGPDDTQVWSDENVVLAFARLSIIDIEGSAQPLSYDGGRYRIIFNGEIYNYLELRSQLAEEFGATFATDGDTEAIVAAYKYWGDGCVSRLRGMFAFAIWDTEQRRLFGARDYFGIKPLYYAEHDGAVLFGSEKKCLLDLIGSEPGSAAAPVDTRALQDYLTLQYVPEPASMQTAVRRIESGCTFTVEDGALVTKRYFDPHFPIVPVSGDAAKAALYDRIADVMDDSVRMHMRADVTVGSFLSGGIDSTAIAALAKRYNPDLLTFTVGFERDGFSEIDVARESAEAIGVRHITRVVTPQEFMDAVPLIVWYLDDPVADPALVPLWFIAREARKHVKVVLSGEGADELFGGYNIYREPLSLAAFEKVPGAVKRLLASASRRLPDGMRGKDLLRRGTIPIEQRYYGNARLFRDDELGFLRSHDSGQSIMDITRDIYARAGRLGLDDVTKMQYVDLFTWLRGDILVKADKVTMANSLELRVPFLDKEVFALASTIPVDQKVTKETTKYALRQALRQVVPAHIFNRRKLGFPVPTRHWLKDEMYDWARQIIRGSGAGHLIDLPAIEAMLEAHRAGPLDYSRKIWTVLVFLIWHAIFIEGSLKPEIPDVHYPVRL